MGRSWRMKCCEWAPSARSAGPQRLCTRRALWVDQSAGLSPPPAKPHFASSLLPASRQPHGPGVCKHGVPGCVHEALRRLLHSSRPRRRCRRCRLPCPAPTHVTAGKLAQSIVPHADLLALTDELLLSILHRCGAPAVARCGTLCKRLRALQAQLAGLPAFAAAATIEGAEEQSLEDAVTGAVTAALHQMPAAVDFCLCFVATPGRSAADQQALQQVVPWCQARLPAGECGARLVLVLR